MEYLRVRNWEEFQHYKDRNPPWIKLHRALLDNYEFCSLKDSQKAHLVLIWILASQNDGLVPNDRAFLEKKLSCIGLDLSVFVQAGFLIVEQFASNALAGDKQSATVTARLEEKRREEEIRKLAESVLDHLNKAASRNFRSADGTLKHIVKRLKDGATVEQCISVIDLKVSKWLHDPKMSDYLRPATLFAEENFENYLGEIPAGGAVKKDWE
jgi:uncharacterized phage protein (TIGR02220 family)